MNPFVGTWVANLEKSRRHANHQFQRATLTFDVSDDAVTLIHAGVHHQETYYSTSGSAR